MKDKICSALRFLIRLLRFTLVTLSGKKRTSRKHKCDCEKRTEENIGEKENNS